MNTFFSVIVPCYNYGHFLGQTLQSVKDQSFDDWECIIVDDGSADNTKVIADGFLNSDNRFKYIYRTNGGLCAARNTGQEASSGKYYIFLDSDDLLCSNALNLFSQKIIKEDADCVAGDWINFYPNGSEIIVSATFNIKEDPFSNLIKNGFVVSSVAIKANKNKWNTLKMPFEVSDYFNPQLADYTVKIKYADGAVTKIRQHTDSERLSIKLNHFEPFRAGKLFSDLKQQLEGHELLNFSRQSALDYHIFQYGVALFRLNEKEKANELFSSLSSKDLSEYYWFKATGISGFFFYFKGIKGLKLFLFLNKIIGR